MNERMALLRKLNAYAFAAYDWNLYLDTHPMDRDAIAMFHRMEEKAKELKKEYEAQYGPLTAAASQNAEEWDWIADPWPWEKG